MPCLNPKIDIAFKKIFDCSQNKDVLISFLNALLFEDENEILDLQVVKEKMPSLIQGLDDYLILVEARTNRDKKIVIEVQSLNVPGFEKRSLVRAAEALSPPMSSQEKPYKRDNSTVVLIISDIELFSKNTNTISHFSQRGHSSCQLHSGNLTLLFVELPKFVKNSDALTSITEQWLYFFKHGRHLAEIPESWKSSFLFEKAYRSANPRSLNREEMQLFIRKQMFIDDFHNSVLLGIRKGFEIGTERSIAKALLDVLDVETISKKTGLSVEEIATLN